MDPAKLDSLLAVLRKHGVATAKLADVEVQFFAPDHDIDRSFDEQLQDAEDRRPVRRLTDPSQVTFK